MSDRKKEFLAFLRTNIETYRKKIRGCGQRLAERNEDPITVLEENGTLFRDACRLHVYSMVYDALTTANTKATLVSIRQFAHEELVQGVSRLSIASSEVHNIIHQERTSAWCEVVKTLDNLLQGASK